MVKPVVFQIVGYQNSGKTTFTTKLMAALKEQGLKTATIKHHGHGGKPDIPAQKDSSRHLAAGALAAIVEGDGHLILQTESDVLSLAKQIQLLDFFQPDVILIEGHKFEAYPKLVLLKGQADTALLTELKNIKVVVYWQKEIKDIVQKQMKVPCFSIYDDAALSFAAQWITKGIH